MTAAGAAAAAYGSLAVTDFRGFKHFGIIGGTGYTGVELLRILATHPRASVEVITSRGEAGTPVCDYFPSLRGHLDIPFVAPEDADLDQVPAAREEDPEVWTLRRALVSLPEKYREVLVLQVIGGYSGADMAKMLDLPRATVNTRLFRARQQLRTAMEEGRGLSERNREGRGVR